MKHSTARSLGVAIFCIGLILLAIVFVQAYLMLTSPVPGLASALQPGTHGGTNPNALTGAGVAVTTFLLHLATLFVLTIVGSVFSGLGIRLYGSHAHSADVPTTTTGAGGGT